MEKQKTWRTAQHLKTADFVGMQDYTRQSLDHIVNDGITPEKRFAGLETVQTGPTESTTGLGRIYADGAVYVAEFASVISHLSHRPAAQQRIATIVAWGEEIPENIEARAFVTDANANPVTFEPREVTMNTTRKAFIECVYGAESAAPTRGLIDSSSIPICDILMGTAGIISVTMDPTQQMTSGEDHQQQLNILRTWQSDISTQVDTLRSDIAFLASRIPANLIESMTAMALAINNILSILNRPTNVIASFVDRFRNLNDSLTAHAGYAARVEDGLRFPAAAPAYADVSLLNPTDPRVMTQAGVTLPAFDEVVRFSIRVKPVVVVNTRFEPFSGNPVISYTYSFVAVTTYPGVTLNHVRQHLSRRSHRYGDWCHSEIDAPHNPALSNLTSQSFVADQASAYGLAEIAKRPALKYMECLRDSGEPYTLDWPRFWVWGDMDYLHAERWNRFYFDAYLHPYWPAVITAGSFTMSHICHTWLNPNNGVATSVRLFFHDRGDTGDVNVLVCRCLPNGMPDETQVISTGTLALANIHARSEGVRVPIVPAYLLGGQRYGLIIATTGAHTHHCKSRTDISFGTLFYRNSANQWVDALLDSELCFEIGMARFRSTRAEVQMNSASLVGGVDAIRITAASFAPPGSSLEWQVQNAGNWLPLADGDVDALAGSPTTVLVRAVFTGTFDLMPLIDLSQAELEVSSTATSMVHYSEDRDYGANTTQIRVTYEIFSWNKDHHTWNCHLVVGGVESGDGSLATVIDPQNAAHVTKTYTHTVSATSTIDSIKTVAGTAGGYGFPYAESRWDHSF